MSFGHINSWNYSPVMEKGSRWLKWKLETKPQFYRKMHSSSHFACLGIGAEEGVPSSLLHQRYAWRLQGKNGL